MRWRSCATSWALELKSGGDGILERWWGGRDADTTKVLKLRPIKKFLDGRFFSGNHFMLKLVRVQTIERDSQDGVEVHLFRLWETYLWISFSFLFVGKNSSNTYTLWPLAISRKCVEITSMKIVLCMHDLESIDSCLILSWWNLDSYNYLIWCSNNREEITCQKWWYFLIGLRPLISFRLAMTNPLSP